MNSPRNNKFGWYTSVITKYFQMPLHATSKSVYLILFVILSLIVPLWSADAADLGRPLALEGPTEVTIAVFILDARLLQFLCRSPGNGSHSLALLQVYHAYTHRRPASLFNLLNFCPQDDASA